MIRYGKYIVPDNPESYLKIAVDQFTRDFDFWCLGVDSDCDPGDCARCLLCSLGPEHDKGRCMDKCVIFAQLARVYGYRVANELTRPKLNAKSTVTFLED